MPGDYLSANRQAHFGSFGQQENPLTLEQLINQHPSYAQKPPHQGPTPHPHIKTPGPPQLGQINHLLSTNAQLHGHPQQQVQQAPPHHAQLQQQQHHSQLQAQQLQAQQAQQLQQQHLQAQQLQHHSQLQSQQLQSQSQSDKILLQLLLLDQKDKEERDRIRQKQEIEAVLLSYHQHSTAGAVGSHMTSEEQLAQLLLKRRMQQSQQQSQQKALFAQQQGYPPGGGAPPPPKQQQQQNTSNTSSGFGSAPNTTLNSSGNMSTNSAPGGSNSGPLSPTRPFSDIFSPLSNGSDLYRNSFENEFGLDFLREDSQSTVGAGEDVSDLIKQLKL